MDEPDKYKIRAIGFLLPHLRAPHVPFWKENWKLMQNHTTHGV